MAYDIKKLKKSVNGTDTYITPFTDDNLKPSDVIDNLSSTADKKPLSANMGKELNDRINSISSLGRFLSTWNCITGLPDSPPPGGVPYAYKAGDYYTVNEYNDTTTGLPNYRPSGTAYTGDPSTDRETETVGTGLIYYFDGAIWLYKMAVDRSVLFKSLTGDPFSNNELVKAFNTRITKLPLEPYSSTEYKFPFHIEAPVQNADSITAKFHTLVINDGTTRNEYTISLPLADPANDKAGLWNKSLSDMVDIAIECNTEYYTLSGSVTPEQYAALKTCKMARVTITVSGYEIGKALATVYYDAEPPEMIKMFSVLNPFQDGSRQLSGAYLTINDGATIAGHIRYYGNDIEVQPLGYTSTDFIYGMKFNGTEYNFGAKKLGDATVGTSTKPIYLDAGTPTACDYTLKDACAKGVNVTVSSASTDDDVPTAKAVYTALTNGTVSKLGTGTVGANNRPIFWDNGTPQALSISQGTSVKPIYINGGVFSTCDHEINSGAGLEKIISTDTTTTSADTTVYTSLKVDGLLANKSTVTYNQIVTTGTKIAEISIDGTTTDIYAPTSGGGTLTGIQMNGAAVTVTGGIADLGTVITAHQDISGKQDALSTVQLSAVNSGIDATKVATYDGYATEIAGKSTVGVKASGTSTDLVNYIVINGTEYKLGGGSSATTVTAIIGTTWAAAGEFYTQDVTVTGMTSTEFPIVSAVYDGTTKALVESQQTEAAKIVKILADTDKITVYAKEQTTVALTILVKRV